MTQKCASELKLKLLNSKQKFITAGGLTDSACQTEKLTFQMLEINPNRGVVHSFQILNMPSPRHDIIIGQDLTVELGLDIISSQQTLNWEDAAIPWRNTDYTTSDAFFIDDSNRSQSRELRRMNNILDAKYQKADLRSSVNNMEHLASDEQQQLLELLQKYEGLFDGTLEK